MSENEGTTAGMINGRQGVTPAYGMAFGLPSDLSLGSPLSDLLRMCQRWHCHYPTTSVSTFHAAPVISNVNVLRAGGTSTLYIRVHCFTRLRSCRLTLVPEWRHSIYFVLPPPHPCRSDLFSSRLTVVVFHTRQGIGRRRNETSNLLMSNHTRENIKVKINLSYIL